MKRGKKLLFYKITAFLNEKTFQAVVNTGFHDDWEIGRAKEE